MDIEITRANENSLSELHGMATSLMKKRLEAALKGEIEMAAAELSAITKFLKDNHIECTSKDISEQFKGLIKLPANITENEIEGVG